MPFAGGKDECPHYLRLSSGRVFRAPGNYAEISSDGGKTWTQGGQICPYGQLGGTTIALQLQKLQLDKLADTAIQLQSGPHKGRIVIPYYVQFDGEHPDYTREQRGGYAIWKGKKIVLETHTHIPEMGACFVCYSDDEGKTWQASQGFMMGFLKDGHLGYWSCQEPVVAELKDGRILCFMRSTCGRILKSYSSDGGQRWTKVEATDLAMSNSPCALARIPKTTDLVLVWNQMSAAEICKGYRRGRLSIAISKDDGKTWENIKTLELSPGLKDVKRVDPPKLMPMVRGPSGPDQSLGDIPDGFLLFHYPTIYFSEDKMFIIYAVSPPDGPGATSRNRVFPISWLYQH
jgi:hypothetical protein